MKYSINIERNGISLAQGYDINASYKDLTAVCDAIRYLKTDAAEKVLEGVITEKMAIPFKKYNKYMGSRHELQGRKGAYPIKAATEVRHIMVNAIANAQKKGMAQDTLFVVHASANKTHIERRRPSKGSLSWGRGQYGTSSGTHSDLEYAKIEIGVSSPDEKALTENMKHGIKVRNRVHEAKKPAPKPKPKAAASAKADTKK
jgi:large subunit ribosomal protein L22